MLSIPNTWHVIINSNTLNKENKDLWHNLKQVLQNKQFNLKEHISPTKIDCEQIIEHSTAQGITNFIVVGGDGTLNEVLNAVLKIKSVNLEKYLFALIPTGTGNDWARTHFISNKVSELEKMFTHGKIIPHDIGEVMVLNKENINKRYFVNIAGLAFDAEVILRMNKSTKLKKGNKLLYLKNLFLTLASYKSIPCDFRCQSITFNKNVFSIAVGICKYNGGGMMQLPMADFKDGMLDMIVIEPMNIFEIITQLPKLYKGTHLSYKKVHHYRTSYVNIKPQSQMYCEVEGEIAGTGNFEIKSYPYKINVLLP